MTGARLVARAVAGQVATVIVLVAGLAAQSAQHDISVQAGEISIRLGKGW